MVTNSKGGNDHGRGLFRGSLVYGTPFTLLTSLVHPGGQIRAKAVRPNKRFSPIHPEMGHWFCEVACRSVGYATRGPQLGEYPTARSRYVPDGRALCPVILVSPTVSGEHE